MPAREMQVGCVFSTDTTMGLKLHVRRREKQLRDGLLFIGGGETLKLPTTGLDKRLSR